ncbi:hypothetical protein BDV38DRAFT_277239 [Aspergillus pseudotamarii]|uniref:Uncharacterized protein n=1 Tax=Aspergillus pseudotamarii TaxID=132259 RepID=A0A5N6TA14_ASPPS|nr:uncharacterized protein BDV38DRAFT_277239 [Aspergillus pseudotamarii]KAE8143214.1 hypothetical protein BDV38DRAFT_277239 [Aspergillus pseudotamarii]
MTVTPSFREHTVVNVSVPTFNAADRLNILEHRLDRVPSGAEYTVQTVYRNNVPFFTVSMDPTSVHTLNDIGNALLMRNALSIPNDYRFNSSTTPFFLNATLFLLIEPMADFLSRSLNITAWSEGDPTTPDKDGFEYCDLYTDLQGDDFIQSPDPNDVPILHSFTGTSLSNLSLTDMRNKQFSVNESLLNTLLGNITVSIIPFKNLWSTKVNLTDNIMVNVYSLSQPLNIILPYSLTLFVGLLSLLLGLYSLRENGVSAMDGGFLQILTTTRGSPNIDRVARDGCPGGGENIPSALKEMRIRYGELIPQIPEVWIRY